MGTEKKWLVKSSETIQGPLEFDVVVENIFTGEIHLLDEIKGPFERWRPIKDHSLFAAAIEKLKATTYQQRENTVTATVDLETRTQELTNGKTITLTSNRDETLTPTSEIPGEMPETTVVYTPSNVPPPPLSEPPPPPPAPPKKRFPTVFLLTFLAIVFGGAFLLISDFKKTRLIEQDTPVYAQLTDDADLALKVGEYKRALTNFSRAYEIWPDPNLLMDMAPLSIQFAGQLEQTQDQLEAMLVNNRQKSIAMRAYNTIGLAYSYRKQYSEALLSYDKSLKIKSSMPASINKAFVLLKLKKYDNAIEVMKRVVGANSKEAIAQYFYIRTLVEKGLAEDNQSVLKEALSVSDQFEQNFADFRQEVLFLIALVHNRLGASPKKLNALVEKFLQVDFELTQLHVHDVRIDFQTFVWGNLFNHCSSLESSLDDYHKKMLKGFCTLKIERPLQAKKIFEELMSQNNNDGILQALYATTLLKLDDVSRAKNALGFIREIQNKRPVIETILRGCLKSGDLQCGEAIFKGQNKKHISLLYAHWGNSEVNFAKDRKKALGSVKVGLDISPQFAPLLKIKRKF